MAKSLGTINWSGEGNSDSWPATNSVRGPREIGINVAFLSITDSQALIIGNRGLAVWSGQDTDSFSQQHLVNYPTIPHTWVKCGTKVCGMGPGPRVYLYDGSFKRIDMPIRLDLESITDTDKVICWYDSVDNRYCITDKIQAKTWLFDLDRGIWLGTIPLALVGFGTSTIAGSPVERKYVGVNTTLCYFNTAVFTDLGTAFNCRVATNPTDGGQPEVQKQLSQAYIDGDGNSWVVKLYYRNNPGDSWTSLTARNSPINAPDMAYWDPHTYRERYVELTVPASSTVRFRELVIYERAVRSEQ